MRGSLGYGFAGVKVGVDPAGGRQTGQGRCAYTPYERRAVLPRAHLGGMDNSILYLLLPDIRKHVET